MELDDVAALADRLRSQASRVVVGQQVAVDLLLTALLTEGHVLLEGLPGTAKTLLARVFAASLALDFKRIQFTPDLMPGDVLGTNIFNFSTNQFVLTRGPVFTQLLLADEINRTPPKTQSALLQAMQERAVTIDGTTYDLGAGFMVVATQNPLEQEGTYPLPEAQLDRFLMKIAIGYPDRDHERQMVRLHGHRAGQAPLEELGLEALAQLDDIEAARAVTARAVTAQVELSDELVDYAVDIARATREHPSLSAGVSPRAINMLCAASRASALLGGRPYVVPDDIKELVGPVLGHRLVMSPSAEMEGHTPGDILSQIVHEVASPR